jgi:outer membrane protein assembly factor BamB
MKFAGDGAVLAKANRDGQTQIWNPYAGTLLTEFRTVHDGDSRLAIDVRGHRIVAANWRNGESGGVACYDVASGQPIWHRSDITQVQTMEFSPREDKVWCEIEDRPVQCLDGKTGSTLAVMEEVERVFDSPFTPHSLLFRAHDLALESGNSSVTLPLCGRRKCAVFSHEAVYVAELFPSLVRCFEIETGNERWRYECPDDHFLQSISLQSDGFLYCTQASGQGGRVERKTMLIRLAQDSGSCSEVCKTDSTVRPGNAFGNGIVVTVVGEVFSVSTGVLLRRLSF